MRPLQTLFASTVLLMTGCQTENAPGPAPEQVEPPMEQQTRSADTQAQPESDADSSGTEPDTQSESEQAPSAEGAGLKAYIDPETGELTTPPEDVRIPAESQTDTREVREEEAPELIPLEGGGYRAPLGDRFRVYSTGEAPAEDTDEEEK